MQVRNLYSSSHMGKMKQSFERRTRPAGTVFVVSTIWLVLLYIHTV